MTRFVLELDDWEELSRLAGTFDLLCLIKETADTGVHHLVGAKYQEDHISETDIEFNIAQASGGPEVVHDTIEEMEAEGDQYDKLQILYKQHGIDIWYAKRK